MVDTAQPTTASKPKETPLMHSFNGNEKKATTTRTKSKNYVVWLVLIAFVGVATGYGLTFLKNSDGNSIVPASLNNAVSKGKTFGSDDTTTFKDTAEGTVEEGGIEGEGQYHLVRPGGESQNVYMTSSLVDLSAFIGKKVKVWGQTQTAQSAGWLMDVGRVEVLE